ncbi:hypothetical protein HC928_14485 [bacterium]|nr:hypothetical protein [bacterium]
MSQFLDVLRFELAFRRRHPPLWIFTGICFLFGFLSVAIDGWMEPFGGVGSVAINSPVALQRMMLVFCLLLGLVITTAFVAAAVIRDHEYGAASLFLATPLRKLPYLLGRFCGALLAAWLMISGLALGAMLASVMPWLDPERVVSPGLTPYLYSLLVFLWPNLLLTGAITFSIATLTRRMMFSYVAVLGLLVVYIVSGNYISDLDNDFIAAVSDPFGIRAYGFAIRYWTPAEMNTIAAPSTPEILINRAIWIGVGLAILAFTCVRYRMALPVEGKRRRAKAKAEVKRKAETSPKTSTSTASTVRSRPPSPSTNVAKNQTTNDYTLTTMDQTMTVEVQRQPKEDEQTTRPHARQPEVAPETNQLWSQRMDENDDRIDDVELDDSNDDDTASVDQHDVVNAQPSENEDATTTSDDDDSPRRKQRSTSVAPNDDDAFEDQQYHVNTEQRSDDNTANQDDGATLQTRLPASSTLPTTVRLQSTKTAQDKHYFVYIAAKDPAINFTNIFKAHQKAIAQSFRRRLACNRIDEDSIAGIKIINESVRIDCETVDAQNLLLKNRTYRRHRRSLYSTA